MKDMFMMADDSDATPPRTAPRAEGEGRAWRAGPGMRHSIRPRRFHRPESQPEADMGGSGDTPAPDADACASGVATAAPNADIFADTDTAASEADTVAASADTAEPNADSFADTDTTAPEAESVTPDTATATPAPEATPQNTTEAALETPPANEAPARAPRDWLATALPAQPAKAAPAVLTGGWSDLPRAHSGTGRARDVAMPVADAARDSAAVRAFDLLRTRLRQTTLEHGWVNIAVTAPTSGCGNSFVAMNLALSLSRIEGSRTLLMDMNLRRPGLAHAFDIPAPGAMADYLTGATAAQDHLLRVGDTLALGLNDSPEEDAAEILQNAQTRATLDRMQEALAPELVLYDLPPMLAHDDVTAFLPQLDGVLLVSDGTQTMARQLAACERALEGQVPLLGVVLNRARPDSLTD